MRFLLSICLLCVSWPVAADTATVNEGVRVNLRSGKTDNYRIIRSLDPGAKAEVLLVDAGYAQVKTAQGEIGWLPLRLVTITATPKRTAAQMSAAELAEIRAELAKAQAALAESRNVQPVLSVWNLGLIGAGGLIVGVILGAGGLQAYYRRKLNGLRI